jgi:hypothetical protein
VPYQTDQNGKPVPVILAKNGASLPIKFDASGKPLPVKYDSDGKPISSARSSGFSSKLSLPQLRPGSSPVADSIEKSDIEEEDEEYIGPGTLGQLPPLAKHTQAPRRSVTNFTPIKTLQDFQFKPTSTATTSPKS